MATSDKRIVSIPTGSNQPPVGTAIQSTAGAMPMDSSMLIAPGQTGTGGGTENTAGSNSVMSDGKQNTSADGPRLP